MVARVTLEPGHTVIFNNHRLLHGRESYKVSLGLHSSVNRFVMFQSTASNRHTRLNDVLLHILRETPGVPCCYTSCS